MGKGSKKSVKFKMDAKPEELLTGDLTKATVTMPGCGHEVLQPPNMHGKDFKCPVPCKIRVDKCGHSCVRLCHVDDDPDHVNYICEKPCAKAKRGCTAGLLGDRGDHQCPKECYKECSGCDVIVTKKISVCKHNIEIMCNKVPTPDLCESVCNRTMTCGHVCKGLCGKPCDVTQCTEPSLRKFPSPCGHSVSLPCNMTISLTDSKLKSELLVTHCKELCRKELSCGHVCRGTCSECRSGRLHVPCREPCPKINVCGHQCDEPCSQVCPPCGRRCEIECPHSQCGRRCGAPCIPCQEACTRRCVHGACVRRCSEPCSIAACDASCPLRLRCGHACRGLCGEPCPDICRQCRAGDFPTGFLGEEFDDDARFIQLQDCCHVLEVGVFDNIMTGDRETVRLPACPYCRKAILNTNRHKEVVNNILRSEISPIKERIYGSEVEINDKEKQLRDKINKFQITHNALLLKGDNISQMINKAFVRFRLAGSAVVKVSRVQLDTKLTYCALLDAIADCYKTYVDASLTGLKKEIENLLDDVFKVLEIQLSPVIYLKITEQQQRDVLNEMQRLHAIIELSALTGNKSGGTRTRDLATSIEAAESAILCKTKYNKEKSLDALKQLKNALNRADEVTNEERVMVAKAIGLKSGHWYKCPNGHLYCIGDSGSAIHVGTCLECGSNIGGTSHRLLSLNTQVPNMFGFENTTPMQNNTPGLPGRWRSQNVPRQRW